MITTTELLNFLCKAQQLSISCVTIRQNDESYKITLYCDWHDDNDFYYQSIFIDNEGETFWNNQGHDFYSMDRILDEKLEKQTQKEIKEQKRKELIDSLTPEQKELLGVS